MANTPSADIVVITSESDTDICDDRPLISLFKRLIRSENKPSTVLTNTQIHDILKKEFNIDITNFHAVEIDIYLIVVMKYLKSWPEWDNLDRAVNERKSQGFDCIEESVLEMNYQNLKSYLKIALDSAKDLTKDTANKCKQQITTTRNDECKEDDPVLEITASRAQLQNLFYRYPNRKLNNTIFNVATNENQTTHQTRVNPLSLATMLNWWDMSLKIVSSNDTVLYKHESYHKFKYVLVNKRLNIKQSPPCELNQELYIQSDTHNTYNSTIPINTQDIIDSIDNSFAPYILNELTEIIDFIRLDLKLLPPKIFQDATYKRYTNKYPYVRYSSEEVDNADVLDIRKYEIQLEEKIMPRYKLILGNFSNFSEDFVSENSITVHCNTCSVSFQGEKIVSDLRKHFDLHHSNESDFKCTNCEEEFMTESLAGNWWGHTCNISSK